MTIEMNEGAVSEPTGGAAPQDGQILGGGDESTPDFRSTLSEEYRDKYTEFKTAEDFVKGYDGLVKKMGTNPIVKPKDDAPDEEKQAYRDQLISELGLRGEPEDYELELSEELPEEFRTAFSSEALKPYAEWAQEMNVSPEAFEGLINMFIGDQLKSQGDIDGAIDEGRQKGIERLQQNWGDEYQARHDKALEFASMFSQSFVDQDIYSKDPLIIELFDWMGKNVTIGEEDKIRAASESAQESTPQSLREKAKELTIKSIDASLPEDERRKYSQEALELNRRALRSSGSKG
jgi:hypothetical protein